MQAVPAKKPAVELQKRLGYTFNQPALLKQALTHRSAAIKHNERFEFLGDSLLNMFVASDLFHRFPYAKEGTLSRLRSHVVKGETLAKIGQTLELSQFIVLGSGEAKSGGYRRDSILADTVEAIIAAIYLDSDLTQTQQVVLSLFQSQLERVNPNASIKDPKTQLQEWLQSRRQPLPSYELVATMGQSHQQEFYVHCRIQMIDRLFKSRGSSRRKAEQSVASQVLEFLQSDERKR